MLTARTATRSPWARQLLGGALDALSFLNAPLISSGAVADFDDLSMRALVRHLGERGAAVRWANRAEGQLCNRYSFAHLKTSQRHELRTAYAAWLKERAARAQPPVKISPPPVTDTRSGSARLVLIEAGCLICGVDHQLVPAAEVAQQGRLGVARQIWKSLRAYASQLGAQSPVELSGFVCRVCADAVEQTHAVGLGPSALERCLVVYLMPEGVPKLAGGNLLTLSGLEGWGVLAARSQAPPNSAPWEHLGDLSDLRKQLKARLHV